jgi:hypothetical protein
MAPKVVAPCDLNLYILLVFMDRVQTKNDNYQPQDEKNLDIYFFGCTPIKHNNKTPFMKNPKTKM